MGADPAGSIPQSSRDVGIDAARALSILVVVWFHLTFFRVDVSTVASGRPLRIFVGSPGPVGWTLSWFLMVMPLFFVAAGFANTQVLDRERAHGGSYGTWLLSRSRRLLGSLVLYIAVWTTVGTVIAWFGDFDIALVGTQMLTDVLWFLLVYLVLIALAPVMCTAHDRWGVRVLVALGLVALGLDAVRFVVGEPWGGWLNYLAVWPFVHQLGIAYHRGWWRTGPAARAWATVAAALLALLALLFALPYYPRSAIGVGDQPIANLVPPTAAMAVLALGQTAILALIERHAGAGMRRSRRLHDVLRRLNGLAVTIYLWHGPVIALAVGVLYPFAEHFRPVAGVVLGRPAIIALALPLMIGLVPLINLAEQRLVPRLGDDPRTTLAAASMVMLIAGFWLIYRSGTILGPGTLRATSGVLCFTAGVVMFRDASSSCARPRPHHFISIP